MTRTTATVAGAVLGVSLAIAPASMNGEGPSSDVSLSFSAPARLTLHEPVSLRIGVVNNRNEPITIDLGKNFIGNSKLVLAKPDGSRVPVDPAKPDPSVAEEGFFPGPVNVEAGSVFTREVVLNKWFDFDEEGTYNLSITFVGTARSATQTAISVQRQAVGTIRVLPRDERALRQACLELARDAKSVHSAEVAMLATTKLAYMRDAVGVECLGHLVTDPAFLHVSTAVAGLVRSGSSQAREVLEQLRVHPDPERARAAANALDRLDREDARKKAK